MAADRDEAFERSLLRADIKAGNPEAAEAQLARVKALGGPAVSPADQAAPIRLRLQTASEFFDEEGHQVLASEMHQSVAALDSFVARCEQLERERNEAIAALHPHTAEWFLKGLRLSQEVEQLERERDSKTRQISELVRTARSEQIRANAAEVKVEQLERELAEARTPTSTCEQCGHVALIEDECLGDHE